MQHTAAIPLASLSRSSTPLHRGVSKAAALRLPPSSMASPPPSPSSTNNSESRARPAHEPMNNSAARRRASPSSSSSSSDREDGTTPASTRTSQRPKLGSRKSSGTIIVPREHPRVELQEGDEFFDEDDARAMSPRRSSQDLEMMSQNARAQLNKQAKILQASLLEIFNRIEAVKEEHDKLDNNNKFLQKYIGDLMSTSKITSTGTSGRKK